MTDPYEVWKNCFRKVYNIDWISWFMPKKEVSKLHKYELTIGQMYADLLTKYAGSWGFIIGLMSLLVIWIIINVLVFIEGWDPYPFILLNLILSCLAALQAPIILMSQNRQTERDRQRSEYDYAVNRKAEREIEDMQKDLHEIKRLLRK